MSCSQVWVLGDRQEWTYRYRVRVLRPGVWQWQQLSWPHFASSPHGDFVLTIRHDIKDEKKVVYGHTLSGEERTKRQDVEVSEQNPGTAMASIKDGVPTLFSYVETTEPLSVYRLGD